MRTIRHLELFAGVGGFRRAFDLAAKDAGVKAKCVGFSEIDPYAIATYKANFDVARETEMGDLVAFTDDEPRLRALPDFDFLTGGFPCQSFSLMGKQRGFGDVRGNVFFRIIKVLRVKRPPFVLLENVRNLVTHNRGTTFALIIRHLKEAGYKAVCHDVFNTSDFGLAQHRKRVFIFAARDGLPDGFVFSGREVKSFFGDMGKSASVRRQRHILDVLEKSVDEKFYLSDAIKPTILANGTKNFRSKSEINQSVARPLTATMVKMHRACQDNYYSDDFIACRDPGEYTDRDASKERTARKPIRKITPLEAFRLQGFDDRFVRAAARAGVSNHQLYKQAGNAVSVNTAYAILRYLLSRLA